MTGEVALIETSRCSLPSQKLREESLQSPARRAVSSLRPTNSMWFQTVVERQLGLPALYLSVCPSRSSHSGRKRSALLSALRSELQKEKSLKKKNLKKKKKKRKGKSQPRAAGDDMTLVPPASTLLLNLCLHTRRASGKRGSPTLTFLKKHTPGSLKALMDCTVQRRAELRRQSDAWRLCGWAYDNALIDSSISTHLAAEHLRAAPATFSRYGFVV